jgi:predicted nuclease of predicted toxin-antitoxin system
VKLLADQDLYDVTIKWLRGKGHDVVTAKELGLERASDEELLSKAKGLRCSGLSKARKGARCYPGAG